MKTWIILAFLMSLSACGSTDDKGTNDSASQIPAAMECPASQDPAQGCPSPVNPTVPSGGISNSGPSNSQNKAAAASRQKTKTQIIEGRCELWVAGDKSARSCSEVKVMARSTEKGEMRDGVVDGFGITFPDLNEKSYKISAQSENYEVTAPSAEFKPGKRVVLKLKAKPRKAQ